jgi:hypothetical protein
MTAIPSQNGRTGYRAGDQRLMPRIEITGSQAVKRAFVRRIIRALGDAEVAYSVDYGTGENPDVIQPFPTAAFDRFLDEEVR